MSAYARCLCECGHVCVCVCDEQSNEIGLGGKADEANRDGAKEQKSKKIIYSTHRTA